MDSELVVSTPVLIVTDTRLSTACNHVNTAASLVACRQSQDSPLIRVRHVQRVVNWTHSHVVLGRRRNTEHISQA